MAQQFRDAFRQGALAAACAVSILAAGAAQAITVGQIQVKSTLGQNFDASIPVTLAAGEDIAQGCIALQDSPNSKFRDVPMLKNYRLDVQRSGNAATIHVSSSSPVAEPVIRVGLLVRCGSKVSTTREFVVNQTPMPGKN